MSKTLIRELMLGVGMALLLTGGAMILAPNSGAPIHLAGMAIATTGGVIFGKWFER